MTDIQDPLNELNVNSYESLIDAFEQACEEFAERPAFTALGQAISFAQLEQLSRQFSAYLLKYCDLEYGDRVAIQLPNLLQYPIAAWGVLRAGFVLVNTNPLYTPRELVHQFNDAGVKLLVVLSDLLPVTESIIDQTEIEKIISTSAIDMLDPQTLPETKFANVVSLPDALKMGENQELPMRINNFDDLAVLQYTGGTTGVAKGAMLSQGNLFANAHQGYSIFTDLYTDYEIGIAPMPLYHVYGFAVSVITGVIHGGHSVLIPNPRDLDSMVAVMCQQPFTGFAGINTLFAGLLRHPDFDKIDFSRLTVTVGGGTTMVPEITREWKNRTGCEIYEGYGLSETTSGVSVNVPGKNVIGSVGTTTPHTEVKIVDEDNNILRDGEKGELLVRGPQVMQGYWQRQEATSKVLDADGWFRTGDVAIRESSGVLRIVDRIKDMILVSGFNVYATEVEAVLYTHADVSECAAVGVPDEKTGEAVKLYVVSSNPNLSADDLIDFCREQLTAYKVPKQIEFRQELPKSPVGKILRRLLREENNT